MQFEWGGDVNDGFSGVFSKEEIKQSHWPNSKNEAENGVYDADCRFFAMGNGPIIEKSPDEPVVHESPLAHTIIAPECLLQLL